MTGSITLLIVIAAVMFAVLGGIILLSQIYNLNNIKSKTVGNGQHGTARWASKSEIKKTYRQIPFTPKRWREQAKKKETPTTPDGEKLPQGIVVGCTGNTTALVDTGDIHVLMIGAAGVGKTAFWLYPCTKYACASGMSFLSTDTKGDVMRNYGSIAKEYGYSVSVIDLRNPTRSNGNNLLHLVNKKNYGKEGAEIIVDNTQLTLFGGFAPNSSSAEILSKGLGSRTVMSGSVSRGKNDPPQSLQMIDRSLLTPDELKFLLKGEFVVMKTGVHPMRVKLKLFFKWGIEFDEDNPYTIADNGGCVVQYAEKKEIMDGII